MNRDECIKIITSLDTRDERIHFIHKYLFHGIPYVFNDREDDYFDFRKRISNKFDIGFHEVFIVGSAKLGFSYHKNNFFNYDSDVDVVIVNSQLFEKFYSEISDYQYMLDKNYKTIDLEEMKIYNKFLKYLVKGWMRPDKLPTSFQVDLLKNDWFDFFESISYSKSEVGDYKVNAGLFKNYTYLEKYYLTGIDNTHRILSGI